MLCKSLLTSALSGSLKPERSNNTSMLSFPRAEFVWSNSPKTLQFGPRLKIEEFVLHFLLSTRENVPTPLEKCHKPREQSAANMVILSCCIHLANGQRQYCSTSALKVLCALVVPGTIQACTVGNLGIVVQCLFFLPFDIGDDHRVVISPSGVFFYNYLRGIIIFFF